MKMSRTWAMPSADTLSIAPISRFVDAYAYGLVVDPFARNSKIGFYTNDLNPNTAAEYHMDAEAFCNMLARQGVIANCVIFDPPYSPRQIKECYESAGLPVGTKETQNSALYCRVRTALRRLCRPGTFVLSFGWNSAGMGNGFECVELLLVAHGGAHNDTICLAEKMVEQDGELFPCE